MASSDSVKKITAYLTAVAKLWPQENIHFANEYLRINVVWERKSDFPASVTRAVTMEVSLANGGDVLDFCYGGSKGYFSWADVSRTKNHEEAIAGEVGRLFDALIISQLGGD